MIVVTHVMCARRIVVDGRTRGLEPDTLHRVAVTAETEVEGELLACQIAGAMHCEMVVAVEIVEIVV